MPVSIRDDYPPGTRGGNTCTCCKAGRRDVRDPATNELRKELIVDLGDTVEYEGFVMVCESCVREAAGLLGMIAPGERDEAVASMHAAQAAADEALAERDEMHQLVHLLRTYDDKTEPAEVAEPAQPVGNSLPSGPVHKPAASPISPISPISVDSTVDSTSDFVDSTPKSGKPARKPRVKA